MGIHEVDALKMIIPDCCKEGWDNCPHVINRPKKPAKRNIGL